VGPGDEKNRELLGAEVTVAAKCRTKAHGDLGWFLVVRLAEMKKCCAACWLDGFARIYRGAGGFCRCR